MLKEKLRWHEDRLRRKFPHVVVGTGGMRSGGGGRTSREREMRKAVWAAIAEGSAIAERRLAGMN